ncbi:MULTISPECIES: DUF7716 domain-containing protein [Pseudomonas]|uniref:DUF7716 domain-containing protein n=1 Tax=Pseudomonas TaxID=286 RepID=UPI0007312384|nr:MULTISPECIES: hypothetical protein [Pseudomonas]KTB96554.1 hypothetical protein AO388_26540 [Pseudomonas sp. ICMP 10191]MCK9734273.1 hypothetical protein [Pseudomonas syringae pv. syringae]MCK9744293.1 hypothetical protein [Pseudomonas syringae pv. syringae]MCK9768008.1 hypothetical protein [Pseudomonas syringae pv. syringae]RMS22785.1 hypothetical protein ALP69_03748 [Pseudomonas syringae pv. aceris]
MESLNIGQPITVAKLIGCVQSGITLKDDLCLYANNDVDVIEPETICYLDCYPEIVNDKEVFSDFVTSNGLQLLYYGQQFNDVLMSLSNQKKPIEMAVAIQALNYYLENDDFLDIV